MMSLAEAPSPQVGTEVDYTPAVLADIWVASYRFAQGTPTLQKDIIGYLCKRVLPASILDDAEARTESFQLAKAKIKTIVNSDGHNGGNGEGDKAVQEDFAKNVVQTIEAGSPNGSSVLLRHIVRDTLSRDATYMPANDPNKQRRFGSANNRYFSYGVRYVLLQKPTPQPAINDLFQQAHGQLAQAAKSKIYTYDFVDGGLIRVPRNTFAFQDVLDAHALANPRDIDPMREALAKLGMEHLVEEPAIAFA